MSAAIAALIGALALLHSACASANWIGELEATLSHDNNVNRAQRATDILSDSALLVRATGGKYLQLTDRAGVAITGTLEREERQHYSGLSHFGVGPSFALKTKLGLGPQAPWLRLGGTVLRLEYDDDLRSGWLMALTAGAGKRFGERLDLRAELRVERRTADRKAAVVRNIPGDAFDLDGVSGTLGGTFALTNETLLTFGYTQRVGEVVSSTRRNTAIFTASKAITPDPVFGPDFIAYKLDARSKVFELGLSHAVGNRTSLNIGVVRNLTYGDGGNNYYSSVIFGSLLHSF